MPSTELPHTAGCIVCGRQNSHGLKLSLHVNTDSGLVTSTFTPRPEHIGFEGIIHGGILATVLDEAMVWAATWAGRRFCVCGELNVRYRQSVPVGVPMQVQAKVDAIRSRLIEVTGTLSDASGAVFTSATGKYVPVPSERNAQFLATLIPEPAVEITLNALQSPRP